MAWILRTLSVPDGFFFFIDPQQYTGKFALSLSDFCTKLNAVPLKSIEFHFQQGDFERWIRVTLGDEELAERISRIDRSIHGEESRTLIQRIVEKRLEELSEEDCRGS